MRVWPVAASLLVFLGAAGDAGAHAVGRGTVRRLIEPPAPPLTAPLRRVVLGSDSRLVLGVDVPAVTLVDRDVRLPEEGPLRVTIEIPDALASAAGVHIDGQLVLESEDRAEMNGTLEPQPRSRVTGPSITWHLGEPRDLTYEMDVPSDERGGTARLSVSARSLERSRSVHRVGPVPVPPDAPRLRFAFGVEQAGWTARSPAVSFRVVAHRAEGGSVELWSHTLDPARGESAHAWHPATISLAPVAGEEVELVFEALPAGADADAALGALGVFANPAIRAPRPSPPERRNLIVISADTLRAQSVGAYGYRRPTTPNVDRRLAAKGATVRDAIAPMPFTPASHMSLFTGLSPCEHGVFGIFDALPPDVETLAEVLRAGGYQTAAFTEDAFLVAGGGFDRGFDLYVENRGDETLAAGYADQTFEQALVWLNAASSQPFFLFVHTYQVHAPYDPPRGFEDELPDGDDESESARDRDRYDREIRHLDQIVGEFLDGLAALGLDERTLVVFTSDHGEGFGEHRGARFHNWHLWDEILRVPLILRSPGQIPPGKTLDVQVGLIDVMPTVLDLLDLDVPGGLEGRSFAGALRASEGTEPKPIARPILSRSVPIGKDTDGRPNSAKHAARTHDWKYIRTGKREALFDIRADPGETRDVADEHPDELSRLRQAVDAHAAKCDRARAARSERDFVTRPPVWVRDVSVEAQRRLEETQQKLRSLGYVE